MAEIENNKETGKTKDLEENLIRDDNLSKVVGGKTNPELLVSIFRHGRNVYPKSEEKDR